MTTRPFRLHTKTEVRIAAIADRCEIDLLEIALLEDPDDFDVLVCLGELYSRVGRHLDGLGIDTRLVEIAPLDPIVHYNLACSLSLNRQIEEALVYLAKAIRLGYDEVDHLMQDADLETVRFHPAFGEILRLLRRKSQPA